MQKDGFIDRIGAENACENLNVALQCARDSIAQKHRREK
jgi:hypothetical protein